MNWRKCLLVFIACSGPSAREWRSADGTRTMEAQFAGMKEDKLLLKDKEGKATVYPAAAFSQADQQFAQQAQVILDAAVSAGTLDMQVDQLLPEGYVCRVIKKLPVEKETWIATGSPFLVLHSDAFATELGAKVMGRTLYHAGTRTFQALDGKSTLINTYSVSLDEAVETSLSLAQSGGEPAKVVEPSAKLITARGLALPLGNRRFITEAAMVKDSKTVNLHIEDREVPATVVQMIETLDVALLSCDAEAGPRKLLPRKPVERGQKIFAVSLALAGDGRTFATATRAEGRISRLVGDHLFEHDATIPESSKGGYVVDEKGEVLGLFFSGQSRMVGGRPTDAGSGADQPAVTGLSDCIRIDSLEQLFPENGQQTPGVPLVKPGANGDLIAGTSEMLRRSSLVVVASREEGNPAPQTAAGTKQPAAGGAPITGWSLSSSGTRHNSNCRYFRPQSPCQATDGKACKICGG
ncbi:serine protease [Prosthecobacter sp.]|uniref:S1 family peptidase n=1 Tax=Prosthecobacter sp. TaxID=1965333 RepID=UPI001E1ABED8|nr:serine protease [Prosthecobacter sp.]MCB1279228.1 trypsin-like peptidase domain-containing protein [Prosthecobacter sp.]